MSDIPIPALPQPIQDKVVHPIQTVFGPLLDAARPTIDAVTPTVTGLYDAAAAAFADPHTIQILLGIALCLWIARQALDLLGVFAVLGLAAWLVSMAVLATGKLTATSIVFLVALVLLGVAYKNQRARTIMLNIAHPRASVPLAFGAVAVYALCLLGADHPLILLSGLLGGGYVGKIAYRESVRFLKRRLEVGRQTGEVASVRTNVD